MVGVRPTEHRTRRCAVGRWILSMSSAVSAAGGVSPSNNVEWRYLEPGQPMQNGFIESINGRMLDELLNDTLFRDLAHARALFAPGVADYNTEGPHSALGYRPRALRPEQQSQNRPPCAKRCSARRAIAQPDPRLNANQAQVSRWKSSWYQG